MKRGVVEYPSSGEDEHQRPAQEKKRKLPTLSASLTVPTPVDDPALHQGRVRTAPHVEGHYATYVYVPLVLQQNDPLHALLDDALALAKSHVPSLHPISRQEPDEARWALHLSLSRPLFLRAYQRDEFKRAVRRAASSIAPFDASFTSFSELTNDERTRTFLALDLGAGHGEVIEFLLDAAVPDDPLQLCRCLGLLGPTLRLLRQKEFYLDPKFHASIAWALMEKPTPSSNITSPVVAGEMDDIASSGPAAPEEQVPTEIEQVEQPSDGFVRIPRFPPTLIPILNEAYAAKLSQARTGGFVADRISTKIGKEVFTWPLDGIGQIGN